MSRLPRRTGKEIIRASPMPDSRLLEPREVITFSCIQTVVSPSFPFILEKSLGQACSRKSSPIAI